MREIFYALIRHTGQSGWRLIPPTDAPDHHYGRDDSGGFSYWRGCLRLPLCLTDSTFVVDNIRCQHSPPSSAAFRYVIRPQGATPDAIVEEHCYVSIPAHRGGC